MTNVNRPIECANCLYQLDEPTVVVDGRSYCCSGCVHGGPCICSYNHTPTRQASARQMAGSNIVPLLGYNPAGSSSESFNQMVENILKEVKITQQAIKDRTGPVKDLLLLLERATRLLQIMTCRMDEQKSGVSSEGVTRALLEAQNREHAEPVRLLVQNATEPDMAFSYTKALSNLDSVRNIKLFNTDGANLHYQVNTTSKARFAREVMSLPDYHPLRIQSTPDEITILLPDPPESRMNKLARSTGLWKTLAMTNRPNQRYSMQ